MAKIVSIVTSTFFYIAASVFILSALSKAYWFSDTVKGFEPWYLIPDSLTVTVVGLLIAIELALGCFLVLRLYPIIARSLATVFLVIVTAVYGYEVQRVHSDAIECMCFGKLQYAEYLSGNFGVVSIRNLLLAVAILIVPWVKSICLTSLNRPTHTKGLS